MRIDALTLPELLGRVKRAVIERASLDVFYVNVHSMNVAAHDAEYRAHLDAAGAVYCDGTGVRLAARILGMSLPARMTGADWIEDLASMCVAGGYALFLLGGVDGTAARAGRALQARHPGLRIVGTHDGYSIGPDVVVEMRERRPDIVLVGMGTPRQERWIHEQHDEIGAPVLWAVGALFDFISGRLQRGPRWMTDNGLEWLCRLVVEPRKLWRRYLIGIPAFFWRVFVYRVTRAGER